MEDAGLIAAVGATPAVEASLRLPSRREIAGRSEPAKHPRTTPGWLPGLIVLGAAVLAFGQSLVSLASGVPLWSGLGTIGLLPCIAGLTSIWIAASRRPVEPAIHDRYLDYIVGLAMLGAASAAMIALPQALSIFFWSWRLDVVALVLFLAGSIALTAGSRALWRFRLPLAFLLLAWPLPYTAAGPAFGALALIGPPVITLSVVALLLLRKLRSPRGRWHPILCGPARKAPQGRIVATFLITLGAVLCSIADRGWSSASALLAPNGQPYTTVQTPAEPLPGLTLGGRAPANLPILAAPAELARYTYTADPPGVITSVEVLAPRDERGLTPRPASLADRQGLRLDFATHLDLGSGIVAHLEAYSGKHGSRLQVVWWDWPVQSGAAVRRERVIVQRLMPSAAIDPTGAALARFARDFAAAYARLTRTPELS